MTKVSLLTNSSPIMCLPHSLVCRAYNLPSGVHMPWCHTNVRDHVVLISKRSMKRSSYGVVRRGADTGTDNDPVATEDWYSYRREERALMTVRQWNSAAAHHFGRVSPATVTRQQHCGRRGHDCDGLSNINYLIYHEALFLPEIIFLVTLPSGCSIVYL